jgi:hypothetical protein
MKSVGIIGVFVPVAPHLKESVIQDSRLLQVYSIEWDVEERIVRTYFNVISPHLHAQREKHHEAL